jgi:hypothetical protein
MGAIEEYKARNAAREARRAEKPKPPEKRLWWFNQPLPIDRFTDWLVAWTALLFIATIGNAIILKRTDDKIGEQANISGRQLTVMENDKRPWLNANISLDKHIDITEWGGSRGVRVPLKFAMKNYGQVPAVNIRVNVMAWPHPGNPRRAEILPIQKRVCEQGIEDANKDPTGGFAIFPSEATVVDANANVSGSEIYKDGAPTLWAIFGCVDYTYGDGKHGQTGFNFLLGRDIDGQVFGVPFVEGKEGGGPTI